MTDPLNSLQSKEITDDMSDKEKRKEISILADEQHFQKRLKQRHQREQYGRIFYYISIGVAILALITLFASIINKTFGAVLIENEVNPADILPEDRSLDSLNQDELIVLLSEHQSMGRMLVYLRDEMSRINSDNFLESTLRQVLPNATYPDGLADLTIDDIRRGDNASNNLAQIIVANQTESTVKIWITDDIIQPRVIEAWTLLESAFAWDLDDSQQARLIEIENEIEATNMRFDEQTTRLETTQTEVDSLIEASISDNVDDIRALNRDISTLQADIATTENQLEDFEAEYSRIINSSVVSDAASINTDAQLIRYYSWLDSEFLQRTMSSEPTIAGIRTAIFGSIYMMIIVIAVALPIGVGTALYLEEYARDTWFNRIIETNVRNLAGVPSIIYGLLGLAIFVRALAPITSGYVFGYGIEPPTDQRLVAAIAEGIQTTIRVDDGEFIGVGDNSRLTEGDAQALFDVFKRIGTPGFTNLRGEINTQRAANLILAALDIEGNLTTNPNVPADIVPEMLTASFDNAPITFDEFIGLTTSLKRLGNFTVAGRTLLSGALTLALLILPIIIISAQEALRAVPFALREASYGLGATQWQTIWRVVLPTALPGILTGLILSVSRAVGETAPLIVVGAATLITRDPDSPFSNFTALPIQIFEWAKRPQAEFQFISAAAIMVLLVLVITLNAVAIILRNRYSQKR